MRVCAPGCGRAGAPGVGAGWGRTGRACGRGEWEGREGGNHRAPPLGPARCLAMSQPAPAPTSSVWVSGSCPEGLCRWPGQPTYPPGLGAGQRPMSAANSHSEDAAGPRGGPPSRNCQWLRRGRGCPFHVWLTALCLFFSLWHWNQTSRRGREGGEEGVVGERDESASEGQKLC